MKLREIIGAHDPNKAQAGSAAAQISDGVDRIPRSDDGFETADIDPGIVGHPASGLNALVEIVQAATILERIDLRHQHTYAIELQPLVCKQADGTMGDLW